MIHEFVEHIPDDLKEGTIYVSMTFRTVAHKCCCGCGNEVITPLSPTDWKLTFNNESISLYPSIGNWNFDCKSHYWIKNNRIIWARQWSKARIDAGRHHDYLAKRRYYNSKEAVPNNGSDAIAEELKNDKPETENNFWSKLKKWWSRNSYSQ